MGNNLYDNLRKATNNIDDITTEKYGVITKLDGIYCSVKETDNELEHNNVPIINGANLSVGDKVIIGFLNNSIYDVVCYGALDKQIHDDSKQDLLVSGQNIKTINHTSLLGSGNIDIQGGSNVDVVTSWEATLSDTKVPSEKLTKNSLDAKADASSLATVATTGDYDDLTDKPSIPSSSSDLSDGSNIVKKSSTSGLLKNDGSVDTTAYSTFDGNYNNLTNKPTIPTIPKNVSAFTNDVGYLTQHQSLANYIQKSSTSGLLKNDGTVDTTSYLSSLPSHTHDGRYYTESEMDGLLNNKLDVKDAFSGSYNDLSDVPTSFNPSSHNHSISDITDFPTLHTVATSGSYNDLLDKPNIPSGVVVDLNLDGTSNNAVANSAVVGGLNDKIEASDISFGFDADTKEIYIEVK